MIDTEFSLEVCVDTIAGLHTCMAQAVQRVELCSALALGGLSPHYGLLRYAARMAVPVMVMIRPRAGDFRYSAAELELMCADIAAVREAGLHGVVLGAGTANATLDVAALEQLCAAAGPLQKTLHRVIDTVADPLAAIDTAVALGFDRILSSGGASTAALGSTQLGACQRHAAGRIEIMAGAGLTPATAVQLWRETGISAFHASCSVDIDSDPLLTQLGFSTARTATTDSARIAAYHRAFADLSA